MGGAGGTNSTGSGGNDVVVSKQCVCQCAMGGPPPGTVLTRLRGLYKGDRGLEHKLLRLCSIAVGKLPSACSKRRPGGHNSTLLTRRTLEECTRSVFCGGRCVSLAGMSVPEGWPCRP